MGKYLQTHFLVTTEGLHLRRYLGQWTCESNLEWRYAQSPTDVLFDKITFYDAHMPLVDDGERSS